MELKATILEDSGKKPWTMEGRSGESRKVLVRTHPNEKIVLIRSDVDVDLSEYVDKEVTLHVELIAGERLAAVPRIIGYDE